MKRWIIVVVSVIVILVLGVLIYRYVAPIIR